MNTFRLMHLRQLKRQPLRVALAVLAIAAGVTLTVAVLIARSSLDRTFNAYNNAIGGSATVDANVAAGNAQGAWTGLTVRLLNGAGNQDNCKGQSITIDYTANGS